jgi:hypothetical protein
LSVISFQLPHTISGKINPIRTENIFLCFSLKCEFLVMLNSFDWLCEKLSAISAALKPHQLSDPSKLTKISLNPSFPKGETYKGITV